MESQLFDLQQESLFREKNKNVYLPRNLKISD